MGSENSTLKYHVAVTEEPTRRPMVTKRLPSAAGSAPRVTRKRVHNKPTQKGVSIKTKIAGVQVAGNSAGNSIGNSSGIAMNLSQSATIHQPTVATATQRSLTDYFRTGGTAVAGIAAAQQATPRQAGQGISALPSSASSASWKLVLPEHMPGL